MLHSHCLTQGLYHKLLRDGLPLGVGGAGDTALSLDNCLAVVEDVVFAGELLTRAICNFSSLLICCLEYEYSHK